MRPIGGYFELECGHSPLYHGGVYVNSGRNALRLIIRTYGIRKIYIPEYTCPTVSAAALSEGCQVSIYSLDENLFPVCDFAVDDYIVYNNYFGCCGLNVKELAARYTNLIVDNSQAFYAKPCGLAAFYSPRKFFGVPDGGIAIGAGISDVELPKDMSYGRMSHLVKRLDIGPEAGYGDFKENSLQLAKAPVARMSSLTRALIGNLNYTTSAQKRRNNFAYLHERLCTMFPLALAEDDVPLIYPYVNVDGSLRKRLIGYKIFVAKYWSGLSTSADRLADRIIPLPIDQRYDEVDMERIVRVIAP